MNNSLIILDTLEYSNIKYHHQRIYLFLNKFYLFHKDENDESKIWR